MENKLKYSEMFGEDISEEECKKRIGIFYDKLHWLHENMHHLSYKAYRVQFTHIFRTMDLGQYIIMPNTTKIEEREDEVYTKEEVDAYYKENPCPFRGG